MFIMGTDHLVNELKECENDIFQVWLRRMRKAGFVNPRITNREDFRRKFSGIMSALEACNSEPPAPLPGCPLGDRRFLVQPLAEEARLERERGWDMVFFLEYFKAMVSCIEDRIAGIDLNPKQRITAIINLRRIADLAEMAAVADWNGAAAAGKDKRSLDQETSDKILGAIFMSVGEGILLVDGDFEIVKANQHSCELFGLQQQNIVGADIRSLMQDEDTAVIARYFDELIDGQRKSIEMTCLYVDGKTFPAMVTLTRTDLDGKRHWSMIVRDETNQKILETQLRQEKQQMEEMNLTLRTVMKSIEQDRKDFENRLASKIKTSLMPGLKKIDEAQEANVRKSYLDILSNQLVSLTAGFEKELDAGLLKLTKTEIEVCRLIKAGCSSKDICDAMRLSFDTIQTHRKNIRRKLSLNGKKLNLYAFLMNRVL